MQRNTLFYTVGIPATVLKYQILIRIHELFAASSQRTLHPLGQVFGVNCLKKLYHQNKHYHLPEPNLVAAIAGHIYRIHQKCLKNSYWCNPGFPDQADHNLTILWHLTNHTNFLTMILP